MDFNNIMIFWYDFRKYVDQRDERRSRLDIISYFYRKSHEPTVSLYIHMLLIEAKYNWL